MEALTHTLPELGWKTFFSMQLSADERRMCRPARVMAVHRGMVCVLGEGPEIAISSTVPETRGPEDRPTVGDWLLIDNESQNLVRILDRKNLFKRPAPGGERRVQLIAANVDTLFIVTSCNQDFSIARLERYLVLAREVGVHPVIVLTKADLAATPQSFLARVFALDPELEVETINGRNADSVAQLAARCTNGETIALMGSSGVGKSTMINTLRGSDSIATQAVRETDGKGRHTTTVRQMHRLGDRMEGGWLVDTPGMRELQLAQAEDGLAEVFDDVVSLTLKCRFTNCTHTVEPQCAVQAAITQGILKFPRLARWRQLSGEDAANTENMALRRTKVGRLGKRK